MRDDYTNLMEGYMTIFKVYEYDGFFFYKVETTDLKRAVRMLWKTFGDKIKYDVV